MLRLCGILALLSILLPQQPLARETGWVPMETYKPDAKPRATPKKPRKDIKKAVAVPTKGTTVYDRQPLITEAELSSFIILLPQFRNWARQNQEEAHPIVNPAGKPDFIYSPKSAEWLNAHGFTPARFFCIMGRMAAGVVIIEEGNDLPGARPPDMPPVDSSEVALARRHLGELLTAAAANQK